MSICTQHGHPPLLVVTVAPLTLLIADFYVPETAFCVMSLRGRGEAAESLQWLRGEETDVQQEWNTIQANVWRQKGPVKSHV